MTSTPKQIASRRRSWTISTIRGVRTLATRTDVDLTQRERERIADLTTVILKRLAADLV